MSTRLLVLVAALAACRTVPPVPTAAPPAVALRLPAGVRPVSQEVTLTIDPSADRFSGTTRLQLSLDHATDRIRLHGRGLHVTEARIVASETQNSRWILIDEEEGLAELSVPRPVAAGEAVLELAWDAAFDDQVAGLYRVKDGDRWYAFTQFEPLFARRAFPCFDEPAFKIPFRLTITAPPDALALANMPRMDRLGGPAGVFEFAPTPPVPTYLVAFAVGPFDVVAGADVPASEIRAKPLPLRGIATKGKGASLAYALAKTGSIVQALETAFGVAYPYDKLDVVAVPDFAAGAMENAGFITFREWLLLVDGDRAPVEQRRAFASVMAHELAHQWFGNLVTMRWWDDLWLNEAFATWMGERTIAAWDPASKTELDFVNAVQGAMGEDALDTARQIRQPIETSHDIHNAFDDITYDKGGGVIAMFERWVGAGAFRQGVQAYLTKHRFGNATAADFLAAVSTAAGRDVATPFRTFLDQPGVPLVDVTVDCSARPSLELKQSRYLPIGSKGDPARTWQIPFCYRFEAGGKAQEACTLVDSAQASIAIDAAECPAWVHPNVDGAGYYRFKLDSASLRRLAQAAAKLGARDQLALADSLSAAVSAGTMPFADVLAALAALASSPERRVATRPFGLASFARDAVVPEALRPRVEAWATALLEPRRSLLSFTPAAPDEEALLFQKTVLGFALETARDPKVREEAAAIGRRYLGIGTDGALHPEVVEPTFAELALAEAVRSGGQDVFDAIVRHLKPATDPALRRRLLAALGWAEGALAEKARAFALADDVRASELRYVLGSQGHRLETRAEAWSWFKQHYDAIAAKTPEEFAGYLPWTAAALCSDEAAADAERFFTPRIGALPGGPRNLAGVIEALHLCAAQVAAHRASAEAFFQGK